MGAEIRYDRSIIVQFASKLYAQARSIVLGYTVLGFLLGVGIALLAFSFLVGSRSGIGEPGMGELMVVGVVGMILGYRIGTERAFALRLQAQVALCQAEIEANTRAALVVLRPTLSSHDGLRPEVQA